MRSNAANEADNALLTRLRRRRLLAVSLALSTLTVCACLAVTGVLQLNISLYGGGYLVERLILTDEVVDAGLEETVTTSSRNSVFSPTARISAVVFTSGAEGIIGMRWFYEDEVLVESFERTKNNSYVTFLEGSLWQPLPSGNYRVEVLTARGSPPVVTIRFKVAESELRVTPAQPTPAGHVDLESTQYLEVPFAFDEEWEIDSLLHTINEVKIVFIGGNALLAVVVETELLHDAITDDEARDIARPVALYA